MALTQKDEGEGSPKALPTSHAVIWKSKHSETLVQWPERSFETCMSSLCSKKVWVHPCFACSLHQYSQDCGLLKKAKEAMSTFVWSGEKKHFKDECWQSPSEGVGSCAWTRRPRKGQHIDYQHYKKDQDSFLAQLTVLNDDVGGKSLSIKCSLTLKTYMEKKRKETLAISNEIILYLRQFFKLWDYSSRNARN